MDVKSQIISLPQCTSLEITSHIPYIYDDVTGRLAPAKLTTVYVSRERRGFSISKRWIGGRRISQSRAREAVIVKSVDVMMCVSDWE